jgi:hypothetical protein
MLTLFFQTTFQGAAAAVKRGLALGFDFELEPTLWWQRKPKALEPELAKRQLRKVAAVIVEQAQQQAEERAPEATRKAEVREAVAPLVQQMPGFDWRAMYDAAYDRALTAAIAAEMQQQERRKAQQAQQAQQMAAEQAARKRRMRDEEEIALLLALI